MNTGPVGSELTKEPFRWDQRLFAIVLALPANASSVSQTGPLVNLTSAGLGDIPSNQFIPAAVDQPITAMCDVTGGEYTRVVYHSITIIWVAGRSYLIGSQRALLQCLESLVQKIQIGVVVNLEKVISEGMKTHTRVNMSRLIGFSLSPTVEEWPEALSRRIVGSL